MDAQKPVVTEQTDKRYKSIQAIGCLMPIVGLVIVYNVTPSSTLHAVGFLMLVVGPPVWLTGRVLGWWNHG